MAKKIRLGNKRKEMKAVEKDISKKIMLFERIENECLTCQVHFDKTDIEEVKNWHVVVRADEDKVNLYCPSCWNGAIKVIEEFHKENNIETGVEK